MSVPGGVFAEVRCFKNGELLSVPQDAGDGSAIVDGNCAVRSTDEQLIRDDEAKDPERKRLGSRR